MPDTPTEILPTPSRRRGAQRGNNNALKHGLYSSPGIYSQQFKRKEASDQNELSTVALSDEIFALRVFIRRLVASSADVTAQGDVIIVLHELSLALHTLTRLIRTQLLVNKEDGTDVENEIKRALADYAEDTGLTV
jgi:hypothetical protein